VPNDYHPFFPLKQRLRGNRCNDDDDVKTEVNSCLSELAASFYTEITLKLNERYDKYYNKLGNYAVK
jgi:hypothetical protein